VIAEAVAAAERIGARETWLIHLTHEVEHDEVEATLPSGVRLAYDGLVLEP
jgi:phosphoribosyl 1,2-cyclic phosphate phosphodiesterase